MTFDERRDRLRLYVFRLFVRAFALFGAYGALARFCARFVDELEDGKRRRAAFRVPARERATVLVLDYERFRGDVDIFSACDDLRVLIVSWNLLRQLLAAYVRWEMLAEDSVLSESKSARVVFAEARRGTVLYTARARYRDFLRRFLPAFLGGFCVDVVINSDFRFRREMDFTRVTSEFGIAHICYYREAMYTVPANYYHAVQRHRAFAPFYGHSIAVQNEVTRRMLIESKLVGPERIVVRGCPRMDGFLRRLEAEPQHHGTRQIAWFSCPVGVGLEDFSQFDLFGASCSVVRALAELARDDPSLRVVLKMKDKHKAQIPLLAAVIAEVAAGAPLPNVAFETGRMAAHNVVLASDVVCAMQSTVVLEAAVAGKPVLVPHFRALREQAGASQALMYQECRDLFDVPEDAADFKRLVALRLNDPGVEAETMLKRRAMFAEYVSPLEGNATELSLELIRNVARSARRKRLSEPPSPPVAAQALVTEAPVLETKRLVLRPFEPSDLSDRYVSWLNDQQAMRYSEQSHRRHTRATCMEYFRAMRERGDWFFAILRRRGEPQHIGNLSVAFDDRNGIADMSILIGAAAARGCGYGLEAWSAVLNDLTGRARIRKVTAGTMAENVRMLAIARRSGMTEEGRQPRRYLFDGREVDLVWFAKYRDPSAGQGV